MVFPDAYTVYKAEYVNSDYALYYLYLTAGDTAGIMCHLSVNPFGRQRRGKHRAEFKLLVNEGIVHIHGTETETGLNADCRITPTQQDGDYDYVEGYEIQLVMAVEPEEAYRTLVESNFNLNALPALWAIWTLLRGRR